MKKNVGGKRFWVTTSDSNEKKGTVDNLRDSDSQIYHF